MYQSAMANQRVISEPVFLSGFAGITLKFNRGWNPVPRNEQTVLGIHFSYCAEETDDVDARWR